MHVDYTTPPLAHLDGEAASLGGSYQWFGPPTGIYAYMLRDVCAPPMPQSSIAALPESGVSRKSGDDNHLPTADWRDALSRAQCSATRSGGWYAWSWPLQTASLGSRVRYWIARRPAPALRVQASAFPRGGRAQKHRYRGCGRGRDEVRVAPRSTATARPERGNEIRSSAPQPPARVASAARVGPWPPVPRRDCGRL